MTELLAALAYGERVAALRARDNIRFAPDSRRANAQAGVADREERSCALKALHVIPVPLDKPLDAPLEDAEEQAEASLAEAKLLASEHGVTVEGEIVRARSIGEAIVDEARKTGADLIVLGSAPRWRRQSRFFSPTVDYVLRRAPSEVMVIAYPQGVLEEDGSPV